MTTRIIKMRPTHRAHRAMLREAAMAVYRAADDHSRLARHYFNRKETPLGTASANYGKSLRNVGDMLSSMADGEEFALIHITGNGNHFPKEDEIVDPVIAEKDNDHI